MMRAVVDDLAFCACDAIVRPATARLEPTTPAVRRLEQVGGAEFAALLSVHTDLVVGAAVVTGAGGDLPAEFVIHAVIQSDSEAVSHGGVAVAWRSALQRAQEWEFAQLSVPPLGIGAGNLAVEDAAELMASILTAHLATAAYPTDVTFVLETTEQRELFAAALERARSAGT